MVLRCAGRQHLQLGGPHLRFWGPLGLSAAEARHRAPQTVAVYPHLEPLRHLPRPLRTQTFVGNYVSPSQGEGIEPGDIRPFAPGDHVRHVNWRATLRLDTLHVTQHHRERNADVVLLLDTLSERARARHGRRRRRAGGGRAGVGVSGPEGPCRSDRVRGPASLGAARLRPRAAAAPARHAPGRLGRLHVRDAGRRPRPPADPAAPGAGPGAQPAARRALRAGREATSRPVASISWSSRSRRWRWPRGRPPEPGRRRRRAALGPGAPRSSRSSAAAGYHHRLGRCGTADVALASLGSGVHGACSRDDPPGRRRAGHGRPWDPAGVLPAAPVTWLTVVALAIGTTGALVLLAAGDCRRIARADRVCRRTRAGRRGRSHHLCRPR